MLFTAVMMAFNAMAMERISSSADMTSLYLGEALTWQVQVQLDDVLTESTIVLPSFPSEFIELDRGVEILTQDGVRLSRHWVKLRPITLGGITLSRCWLGRVASRIGLLRCFWKFYRV
jgi:hypothetical protein